MENFLFITLNIIIGVGLHVLFTVMRAFQVRLIAFILVILILIIAEHLITVNYLNNQRRVCHKLIAPFPCFALPWGGKVSRKNRGGIEGRWS